MTLDEEIKFWDDEAKRHPDSKFAALVFGVSAGLRMAKDRYNAQQEARPVVDGSSEGSGTKETSSDGYPYG
jgi:hypothetical protein